MLSQLALRHSVLVVAVLAATCSGCANSALQRQTADLPSWQPPHPHTHGMRRIAVLEVTGDDQLTVPVRQHISRRLTESGFFETVPLPPLNPSPMTSATGPHAFYQRLLQARSMAVDTIVMGTVRSGYGGKQIGNLAFGETDARVVVTLKIIDVVSGQQRDHQQVLKTQTLDDDDPISRSSEADIINRLARECVDELTSKLFAQRSAIAVPLADVDPQDGAAQRGILLSQQGRWAEANVAWQTALATDPHNHALLYNLGLAYEAQRKYPQARANYQAALSIAENEVYHQAIARTAVAEQRYLLAWQQRVPPQVGSPITTASLHAPSLARRLPAVY